MGVAVEGVSNLTAGLALAIVLLAASGAVAHYLRSQGEGIASGIQLGTLSVSAYAFRNSTSYVVILYNYGNEPRENARVSYYALDGSMQYYNLSRVDPGAYIIIALPGKPVAYSDRGGVVFIRVVNEG